jgi:putative aldouronate transport system permease protein
MGITNPTSLSENFSGKKSKGRKIAILMWNNWQVYLMMLLPLIILIWFRYLPMIGLVISFKEYNLLEGIWGSKWADPIFKYFVKAFHTSKFWRAFKNTLILNGLRLIFQFPVPIIFALMIDECRNRAYKRVIQTLSYLPHFLSWVIVASLFNNLLAIDSGIVNIIIKLFGGQQQVFLANPDKFRSIIIIADIWKGAGWGTIVILAAITSVNPELHEAALMDGAGKLKRIWHVTLPCIKPIIVILLILRVGYMMSDNTEMILQFYSPLVYETGDVLGTYMYRVGLTNLEFSFTTAVGFFRSIVNMLLMLVAHYTAITMGEEGLW